jgi:hypothetical protein
MSYNPLSSLLQVAACILALTAAVAGSVLINEMELNPPEGGTGWVELYNTGDSSVDISCWTAAITDGGWVGKMTAPEGATIPPKGFYVLEGSSSWNHNDGGFATLYDESGNKADETPTRIDSLNNDFAWGRRPDGYDTDTDGDFGLGRGTKGKPNKI